MTRQRIVDAAVSICQREGFEDLTMRAVAAAAGIDVSSIYYHFADKQGLLAAISDATARSLPLHVMGDNWTERCRSVCLQAFSAAQQSPELVLIDDIGTLLTPFVVHTTTHLVKELQSAGFDAVNAVLGSQALLWQVIGTARIDYGARRHMPPVGEFAALRKDRVSFSSAEADTVDAWYGQARVSDLFEFAIDTTLAGLAVQLSNAQRS